jgi:hypothetical protein
VKQETGNAPAAASADSGSVRPVPVHQDCAAHTYGTILRHGNLDPRVLGDHWAYELSGEEAGDGKNGEKGPTAGLTTSVRYHAACLSEWYGIEEHFTHHASAGDAHAFIQGITRAGRPVVVGVDLYSWPRSTFQGTSHYPHRVVVSDVRDGEYFVHDGLGGGFEGWLPSSAVTGSMLSEKLSDADLWGYDASGLTLDFSGFPDAGPPTGPSDALIAHWLEYSARWHVDHGHAVLSTFRDRLAEFAGSPVPDSFFLPGVVFFGSQATQRDLNATFAGMAVERLGLGIDTAVEALRTAARLWNQTYFHFIFGHRKGAAMSELVSRAAERIGRIADTEYEACARIQGALA